MTFRILPVATLRVARITQRDKMLGRPRRHSHCFAPGCRLVTAGDVNMVSADYMGHPVQASLGAMNRKEDELRITRVVQEERPSLCLHVHQRPSRCSLRQRSQQCSGLTPRRSPGGQRQGSSRPSGHSAATGGTGRPRFVPSWRASRSSARNEAVAAAWLSPGQRCAPSRRPHKATSVNSLGGSTPAVRTPHRGARLAFDAMRGLRPVKSPGSIRPPRSDDRETDGSKSL
jgi:hypothetical protein